MLVKDIYEGSAGSYPNYFVNVNGYTYFEATDCSHREALWKTDGNPAETVLVNDITQVSGVAISNLCSSNGKLFLFPVQI